MSALALLKIALIPVLLWGVSALARRFGPLVAGVANGLPLISGPISFVVALEQGSEFARNAAWGCYSGMTCLVVFGLCYAHFGKRVVWPVAVGLSLSVYAAITLALGRLTLPQELWPILAAAALLVGMRLLPEPVSGESPMPTRRAKRPYLQMACGALLMTVITVGADVVGPTYSGMFMFFPVIGGIMGAFFLRAGSVNAVIYLFKGTFLGALTGWSFMMTLIWTLPVVSLPVSYGAAVGAALLVSVLLMLRARKEVVRTRDQRR